MVRRPYLWAYGQQDNAASQCSSPYPAGHISFVRWNFMAYAWVVRGVLALQYCRNMARWELS